MKTSLTTVLERAGLFFMKQSPIHHAARRIVDIAFPDPASVAEYDPNGFPIVYQELWAAAQHRDDY